MAKFFDNMTGWQKLILLFGGFAVALAALVFIPTETGNLLTWIGDMVRTVVQTMTGGTE